MRFKPDISRYTYPEKPDQHMLHVKHQVDTNFDENHRYYNNTFAYHLLRFFANIIIHLFLYPFMYFRYGVKVEGRKNVKKAKKIKGSVMKFVTTFSQWIILWLHRLFDLKWSILWLGRLTLKDQIVISFVLWVVYQFPKN